MNPNILKYLKLIFLLIFIVETGFSQRIGVPFIKYYTNKEYNYSLQNWDIAQDNRGIMYFGNSSGLLAYDGKNWEKFSMTTNRSFAKTPNGKIYVGGQGEIGYISAGSLGRINVVSILDRLSPEFHKFNDVWVSTYYQNKVIFNTVNQLMIYENDTFSVLKSKSGFHKNFVVHGQYLIREWDKGLQILKNGKLEVVKDGEIFKNIRIYSMLPLADKKTLLISQGKGLYVFDKDGIQLIETPVSDYINKHSIYCGIKINDKLFAVGTNTGGILFFDEKFNPIRILSMENGLMDNTVYQLFIDKNNDLWAALSAGVSHIPMNTGLTHLGEPYGIEERIATAIDFNGIFYVGGQNKFYYRKSMLAENPFEDNTFKVMDDFKGGTWSLNVINGKLYNGHNPGIHEIIGDKSKFLTLKKELIWKFEPLKQDSNLIIAGTSTGLVLLKMKNDGMQLFKKLSGFHQASRYFFQDDNGNIIVSVDRKGIFHLRLTNTLDSIEYVKQIAIPEDIYMSRSRMFKWEDDIIYGSSAFYKYDFKNEKFIKHDILNGFIKKPASVVVYSSNDKNSIIFTSRSEIIKLTKNQNGEIKSQKVPTRKLINKTFITATDQDENIMYFHTDKGVACYDNRFAENKDVDYKALVRKVQFLGNDSLIFGGNFHDEDSGFVFTQSKKQIPVIKYEENSLRFTYSALFYENNDNLAFSYKLDGFDDDWSKWEDKNTKEYTNIPEGKYTFQVKAINIYSRESIVGEYKFTVLAPFYRTWLAYFVYFVVLSFVVVVIVRLNSRRLEKANIKLEAIVKERTSELQEKNEELLIQNEEILAQRDEIEEKSNRIAIQNEQITGSIRYAKTIQKAMLPTKQAAEKFFNSFSIYLPKDIVSGDFYWCFCDKKTNKTFVGVVDCTGHGVPGAFMTMIGFRLLNEIVSQLQIYAPEKILDKLDQEVRKALRQEETSNDDGMDAGICLIEPSQDAKDKYSVTFSGAKIPLYYYTNGNDKIQKLPANRKSIGGNLKLRKQIEFISHSIELNSQDIFYLFSDGIIDQPSPERKRLGSKKVLAVLSENKDLPLNLQHEAIKTALNEHQKYEEQRDDITLIGIQLK